MSRSKKDLRAQSPLEAQRKATQQQTLQINLAVLQRIDPSVAEIMDMAGHVVIYKFDMGVQGWQKQDIEGSLFVIRRNAYPSYRLFVLNRSGIHNYEEDVLPDMLIQVEGTYLILRPKNSRDVMGMWFYKEEEHSCITSLVKNIINQLQANPMPHQSPSQRPGRPPVAQPPLQPLHNPSTTNSAGAHLLSTIMQNQPQPQHHHRPTSPQQRHQAPSVGASDTLKGMLGISSSSNPPPHSQLDGAQAGAQLLGLLGVNVPPKEALPQPPAEPPSPGMAIMAMLGRGSASRSFDGAFPMTAETPNVPPQNIQSTLPPALVAAANRQQSQMHHAQHQQQQQQWQPPQHHAQHQHLHLHQQPALLAPHQLGKAAQEPSKQPTIDIPHQLLVESVEGSAGKAPPGAPVMDKKAFQQALQAAVQDETFMSELYEKYLTVSKKSAT